MQYTNTQYPVCQLMKYNLKNSDGFRDIFRNEMKLNKNTISKSIIKKRERRSPFVYCTTYFYAMRQMYYRLNWNTALKLVCKNSVRSNKLRLKFLISSTLNTQYKLLFHQIFSTIFFFSFVAMENWFNIDIGKGEKLFPSFFNGSIRHFANDIGSWIYSL